MRARSTFFAIVCALALSACGAHGKFLVRNCYGKFAYSMMDGFMNVSLWTTYGHHFWIGPDTWLDDLTPVREVDIDKVCSPGFSPTP